MTSETEGSLPPPHIALVLLEKPAGLLLVEVKSPKSAPLPVDAGVTNSMI